MPQAMQHDDFLGLSHAVHELRCAFQRGVKRASHKPVTVGDYNTLYAYKHYNGGAVSGILRAERVEDNVWQVQAYGVLPKDDKRFQADCIAEVFLGNATEGARVSPFEDVLVGEPKYLNTADMIAELIRFDDGKTANLHRHISRVQSRGKMDCTNQPH